MSDRLRQQYRTPEAILALIRDIVSIWDDEDDGNPVRQHRIQSARDRARLAIPGYVRPCMARLTTGANKDTPS